MTQKKRTSFARLFLDLVLVVPNIINLASNMVSLLGVEARLAGKALLIILLLSLMFASLLTISWVCLLGMLFLYLISLHWSWLFSLFVIFMGNTILLLMIGIIILTIKNNLFFSATREKCRALCRTCKEL